MQCLKLGFNTVDGGEELDRFLHRHFQHVVDVLPFIGDLQRFLVVALAMAFLAWYVDVRQKVHRNALHTVALTCFTAAAADVEGEAPLVIAAQLRFRCLGEQIADIVEYPGVGDRVGTWSAADRILRNLNHLVDVFQAQDRFVLARLDARAAERMLYGFAQDFIDQRGFAAAADAGDDGQGA